MSNISSYTHPPIQIKIILGNCHVFVTRSACCASMPKINSGKSEQEGKVQKSDDLHYRILFFAKKTSDGCTATLFYVHSLISYSHTHTYSPITSTSSHLPWGLGRSFTRGRLSESIYLPATARKVLTTSTCNNCELYIHIECSFAKLLK